MYNKFAIECRIRKDFPPEPILELIFINECRAIGKGETWKIAPSRKKKLYSKDVLTTNNIGIFDGF